MLRTWGWQGRPCETHIRESSQMSGSYFSGRNPQTFDVAWKVLRESCLTLAAVINFTAPNKHQWEANMRRAFIILLMSATLGISLQSTTPASAAPERFCAKWLYGASLQRESWGGASYKYERIRCLKWVSLDIPQPNRFVPFFGVGAAPTDTSPWVTLNPQPLPPKARRTNVR